MWERTVAVESPELAEVTQRLLLYTEVAYQLWCRAAGKEAADNFDYGYSTCYGSSSPEPFEKTLVEYKSLTSHLYRLQSFNIDFKAQPFSLHRNQKLPSVKPGVLISISVSECLPASALLSLLF